MKYTKELHDRVRQNLRMFDYPRFDDGDIDALLDEIDRLNAYAIRLLSEESRTWHCECGHNWTGTAIAEGKAYCPECEQPMRPMSEVRQERIAELEAEVDKHRWIPVSEKKPKAQRPVLISCKSESGKRFQQRAEYIPPKTIPSENYLSDEYDCSDVQEYDEEQDCYWVVEGWWESSLEADVNYKISDDVTHWMRLPEPPEIEDQSKKLESEADDSTSSH